MPSLHAKKLMKNLTSGAASEFVPAAALQEEQKAIIAREIDGDPDSSSANLWFDVGAIEYIHKRLIEER